ncbi:Transcriptional regulatory protein UhpA [Mycolicibacterium chubuense]|uniref:Transcriptional regulatory protein UhpA n=2 Tax=Mycolicibacterium chubuense TaxID=1800 RepID=A0A0J6WDC1_MYCCU|nr:Transcriptional regulatory protein UhpA [Mycolicibacterium chubuense]SPX98257.1 two component LuxR family transcriptional regulator [Mycolicibacterium chubuense]
MADTGEGHHMSKDGELGISVVIIDNQYVVHAGIEAWVAGNEPPIKIVGNFAHPAEFMALQAAQKTPVDVVILALEHEGRGPDFGGLRLLCRAGYRVIGYSHLISDEVILTALDAGAVNYVGKSEDGKHLRGAICAARSGVTYRPPRMADALERVELVGRPRLTRREREVLSAWLRTDNKDEVAKLLYIEPSTVATHVQRARAKYAAVGRAAPTKTLLIARAIEDGLIDVDDL